MATRIYEKGPQSLADVIKEVERLQAAQQLRATILSPSSVNVMSSDDDNCFQCQESGHIACHCPHIKYFDCDCYVRQNSAIALLSNMSRGKFYCIYI